MLKQKANESVTDLLFGEMSEVIKRGLFSKIELKDNDVLYRSLNEFLYKLNPKKFEENMRPNSQHKDLKLLPNISYIVKCGQNEYMRISTSEVETTERIRKKEILSVLIFGPQRKQIYKFITKNALNPKRKNMIRTTYISERLLTSYTPQRDFDSIIMDDEIKKYLISNLNKWKNDEKWFKDHHLVYKKGILLHGQPGTGKSSIIKAISNMFDNAYIISIAPHKGSLVNHIDNILIYRQSIPGILIVLIEDVDMFFTSREKNKNGDDNDIAQNELFQIIDGIHSTDNTIYIATTNHIDYLDSALIRPGRFDIKVEIDYFDEEMALKLLKMFGYNRDDLTKMNVTYPIQPALLQSKIMEYRAANDD